MNNSPTAQHWAGVNLANHQSGAVQGDKRKPGEVGSSISTQLPVGLSDKLTEALGGR